MQQIKYSSQYLDKEQINKYCYLQENAYYVNKLFAGNGFSHARLQMYATSENTVHIMIVPNVGLLEGKRETYLQDETPNKPKQIFIWGSEQTDKFTTRGVDTVVIIADVFRDRMEYFIEKSHLIETISCDELHSFYFQCSFRPKLRFLFQDIIKNFPKQPKVFFSATPPLYLNSDVEFVKDVVEHKEIVVTPNQEATMQRLEAKIRSGENVLIATQQKRVIKRLADKYGVIEAHFKIGKSFMESLVKEVEIKQNVDSNIVIISSAAFEGWDLLKGNFNVFIFENRQSKFEQFFAQNYIQIIGRPRLGVKYIELCRIDSMGKTKFISEEALLKKANNNAISFEKRMKDVHVKKYFRPVIKDGFITELEFDRNYYLVGKEIADNNNIGLKIYKEYFAKRGFKFKYLNEPMLDIFSSGRSNGFKNKVRFGYRNAALIRKYNLFDAPYLKDKSGSNEAYLKEMRTYLLEKYLMPSARDNNGTEIRSDNMCHVIEDNIALGKEDIEEILKPTFEETIKPFIGENEAYSYEVLLNLVEGDGQLINDIVDAITKEHKAKKLAEYNNNYKNKKLQAELEEFDKAVRKQTLRMVKVFANDRISVSKKIINYRDYNIIAESKTTILEYFSREYDVPMLGIDVKTEATRILHAFLEVPMKEGIYGKDKKYKQKINATLNACTKEYALEKKMVVKQRKQRIKQTFKQVGFDDKITNFVLENFWEKHRDNFFFFYTYFEQKIMGQLMNKLIPIFEGTNVGLVRKHDEQLIFGHLTHKQKVEVNQAIKEFRFLSVGGWFDLPFDEHIYAPQEEVEPLFVGIPTRVEVEVPTTPQLSDEEVKYNSKKELLEIINNELAFLQNKAPEPVVYTPLEIAIMESEIEAKALQIDTIRYKQDKVLTNFIVEAKKQAKGVAEKRVIKVEDELPDWVYASEVFYGK